MKTRGEKFLYDNNIRELEDKNSNLMRENAALKNEDRNFRLRVMEDIEKLRSTLDGARELLASAQTLILEHGLLRPNDERPAKWFADYQDWFRDKIRKKDG